MLAVEASHCSGEEKGIEKRFPSAASTRRYYIDVKEAGAMGCNLNIAGNMQWEQYAEGIGRNDVFRGFTPGRISLRVIGRG